MIDSKADEANDFKLKGNQSLKAESFGEAVFFYTKAIECDGTNHVYYANRAVAHLRQKHWDAALADADRCIAITPGYVKAYSSKGFALHNLGRVEEAKAAYEAGLAVDADNKTLQANLADLTARIARGAASPASGGAGAGASAGSAAAAGGGGSPSMLDKVQFGLRAFIVVNALLYLVPFTGSFGYDCYRRVMMSAMASLAIAVFSVAGRPKFSTEYAARLVQNPAVHYLFMALLLMTARPSAIALVPIVAAEVMDATGATHSQLIHLAYYLRSNPGTFGGVYGKLAALGSRYLPAIVGRPDLNELHPNEAWKTVNSKLLEWIAMAEVVFGITLVFEVLTPMRNLLATMMFWQTLRIRYMTSHRSKAAFGFVDDKLQGWMGHRFCPKVVLTLYMKLRNWMHGMGQMPSAEQARSGGGGLMSKCSVM